jgi:hypothetical protein
MGFVNDPNDRRRVDPETQRRRDAEVARLRRAGTPFRAIAERLNMSLGAVQKSLIRSQKLANAVAGGEPGDVLAVATDELACEDVRSGADVERLSILELWRLQYVPGLPPDVRAAMVCALAAVPAKEYVYPISDGHHWRDGVDAAMSDDSGVDRDDDTDW